MKQLFSTIAMVTMLSASTLTAAKTINLYAEPKADSKVTGTVNTETGVTIVYTPKSGDWIKVANPTNGEVGWVKNSDIGNGYNMRIITSGNGAHQYSVYQFGSSSHDDQQMEKEMRLLERQQRMMQWHMAHMFNDMFYFPQAIFIPVMMAPDQTKPQKAAPAKTEKK